MIDRTQSPPIQPITAAPPIQARVHAVSDTLKVHVLTNQLQPVVRLDIVYPAGRWHEPSPAVAHLTAKMLLEGTRSRKANEIAEIISFYGASLTGQANGDWSTLSLHCLSKYFEPLLMLIKEILSEVAFPGPEFEQLKTRTAQSVAIERQKNNYLASEALSKKLFGASHPYQSGLEIEAINAATLDQVKDHYSRHYPVGLAQIFLSGDINEQHLNLLAQLNDRASATLVTAQIDPETSKGLEVLPAANNLQAAIHMGQIVPAPGKTGYFDLLILNEVLGGYFGSRLMKNIREDKGLTYGIFSQLASRAHATSWHIRTEVKGDKADLAFQEICREFKILQDEEIDASELELVKNNLLGKLLAEQATPFEQLEWYKFLILHSLPKSFLAEYVEAIHSCQASNLQQAAQQYLKPEEWCSIILAG